MAAKADDNWKQKYLESIDELERAERRLGKIENLMRRGFSRLALAAEGTNPGLDRPLAELRSAVRKDIDEFELNRLFDVISSALKQPDVRKTTAGSPASGPQEILGTLIEAIRVPPGQRQALAELRARLKSQSPSDSVDAVIQAFAQTLNQLVRNAGPDPAAAVVDGSPLTSTSAVLPSADGAMPAAISVLRRVVEHLPPPWRSASTAMAARLDRVRVPAELDRVTADLVALLGTTPESAAATDPGITTGEAIARLIDLIDAPQDLRPRLLALRTRLDDAQSAADWMEILAGLAAVVADLRSRIEAEKSGLESFLRQLTERLAELDQHLKGAQAERQRAHVGHRDLDAAMHQQMAGIESSVQTAVSLEQLKSSVQERVEGIRAQLAEHRQRETERQLRLESQLNHATARLSGLETEAADLRANLAEQRAQAMLDTVTGVANRAAYDERGEQEFERWRRYQRPLALLVIDVDRFKQVNDRYGHKAGDKALRLIATVLKRGLRQTDFLARYGGEEFVVIVPETAPDGVNLLAERLRAAIESCEFHHGGERVPVTVSIGIAVAENESTPEALFQRADHALYQAKAAGRNCFRCADS